MSKSNTSGKPHRGFTKMACVQGGLTASAQNPRLPNGRYVSKPKVASPAAAQTAAASEAA